VVTDPLIGRLVDSRYEIVDRLARGGMATVYRAHDRRLDRTVALKLMHVHLADSPDFVSRFRREARAAARLSNPGVVAVYDQGSLDGVAYLVMEYVEGPTLRDLIAAGPLSVKEALGLVAQLLRPLGAAHRAGLVHRDIKPENVLLPSDGSVAKVADFGLARAVTEVTQTTTGNVLGTVAYLAPELITSGDSTSRADVFSAGVVLYELLTGEQPFTADSPIQIAFRNVHEDVPLPSKLVPDMPADVDELVATMTRREPQERPADADEALALLRNVVDELTDSELSVRRGGGTGSIRTQQVMTANAQAARSAIDNELWDEIFEVYVKDKYDLKVDEFFREQNPATLEEITAVMMETIRKGMWKATPEQIAELARVHTETVNKYGAACSGFVCDNAKLKDFIASKADASAAAQYKQKIAEAREANLSDKDAKSVVLEKDKQNAIDETADTSGRRMILIAAIALVVAIAAFLIIRRRRKN